MSTYPTSIEGDDVDFDVEREQLTTVEFDTDKPGVVSIIRHIHQPAMNDTFVVLPN